MSGSILEYRGQEAYWAALCAMDGLEMSDELPDPEHHPIKVMWLYKWWKSIVIKNRNADIHIQKQ